MELVLANKAVFFGFFFALSEVLSLIPSVKSNGVFELVVSLVKKLAGK